MICLKEIIEEYIDKWIKDSKEKEKISKLLLKDLEKHLEEMDLSYDISIESLKAREDFRLKLSDAFYGMIPENTRDKGYMNKRILAFAEYLRKTWKVELVLDEAFQLEVMNKYERQVDLLKTLNSGMTKSELQKHYSISKKPLESDIDELVMGTRILGQKVKIRDIKRERKAITYQSSIHPVFLPLNLTEAYHLTVGLKLLSMEKESMLSRTLNEMANKVYCQLSEYARDKMDRKAAEAGVTFPYEEEFERYSFSRDEEEMARENIWNAVSFVWKASIPCTLHLKNEELEVMRDIYLSCDINSGKLLLKNSLESNVVRELEMIDILDIEFSYK